MEEVRSAAPPLAGRDLPRADTNWDGAASSGKIASLFNGVIAGSALAAWAELGLFDELDETSSLELAQVANEHGVDAGALRVLARSLADAGIVECEPGSDRVRPGEHFSSAYRNQGYFLWLLGGYGEMLTGLGEGLRNAAVGSYSVNRDKRRIAMAGRSYGRQFVDPIVSPLIEGLRFEKLADLGCGSAERLISAVQMHGGEGIGIEIDRGVAELAEDSIRDARLTDSIEVVVDDVSDLEENEAFADVDCLMSFFMGHDLWPRERCARVFAQLRERFPNAGRFLLCDTFRAPEDLEAAPIFTLGFELTHALMGQYLPKVDEWEPVLAESGWRVLTVTPIEIPSSAVLELAPN